MSFTASQFQSQTLREEALANSESYPVLLTLVEVVGGDNILRHFFSKLLGPLVEKSDYTLSQLVSKVEQTSNSLETLEIFEKITPSLHVDYTHIFPLKKTYNQDDPIVTKVVYDLETKELSEGNLSFGFNSEDYLIVGLGYINNNFNHNAEQVRIGVNYQPYKPFERLESMMRLETNLRNPAFKIVLDLQNSHENIQLCQQNSRKATGGLLGVLYLNLKKTISIFNGISLFKRSTQQFGGQVDECVGAYGDENFQSSVITQLSYNRMMRSQGFLNDGMKITVNNQVSLNQDRKISAQSQINFVKSTFSFDLYKSFSNKMFTAHLFNEAGSILPRKATNLMTTHDKFFLGGLNSFRGFCRNGVNEDGGTQFYKAGMTIYGKIPRVLHPNLNPENNPMKIYATGLVGNVGEHVLKERGVVSVGLGLAYFHQLVEFDAGFYISRRLDSPSTLGVKDGFKLQVSLGGVGGSS